MFVVSDRSRYDSCASSALSSCMSTASSTHSVRSASPQRRRHTATVGRYHASSVTASPYEYDMAATSSESVARLSRTSATRHGVLTSLADSVASDGEVSSCRFSDRGGVSRFLAARRRESIDSGLTMDSAANQADFRRASDPLLNNCGVAETPSITPRCPSAASAPGTAAQWRGAHRVGGSLMAAGSSHAAAGQSLMSSRSSIATNMSDDVDVKFTPSTSEPSVADQVVGGLIIPDEMREFINRTYGSQATVGLTADSTVVDSPATPTSTCDEPSTETMPSALTSCMYEGQASGNSTQPRGNSTQPRGNFPQPQRLARAVTGAVHNATAALPTADASAPSFEVPTTGSSTSYFRSPGVAHPYQNGHEVQVSQISQSWRPESSGGSRYRASGVTLDLTADDMAVRHRRNPHQMNWWTRVYGCRPNYSLPLMSVQPPRTAASFVSSQTSPSCNQVNSCDALHCDCFADVVE